MRITAQQLKENQITGDYSQWKTGRPIYYTWKDYRRINEINKRYYLSQGLPPREFFTVGILYRMVPRGTFYAPRIDPWDYYKFNWIKYSDEAVHWDYLAREILANYNFQLGDRFLTLSQKFKNNFFNPQIKNFRGFPRNKFLEKAGYYENLGFKYYEDSTKYGYDMVAIHFNFAIFIEQRARQYLSRGNKTKAIELYKKAAKKYEDAAKVDPTEVRAYNNWASVYEKIADIVDPKEETVYLEKAKEVLDRAIKINNNYAPLKNNLKRVNSKLQYPKLKIAKMQDAVSKAPQEKKNVDALLQVFLQQGDYNNALNLLEHIKKYYPKNLQYLQYLASLYAQTRRLDKTIYYLKQMIKIQPTNAFFYYALADLYYKQQRYAQAKTYYQKVVKLGSNPQFSKLAFQAQQKLIDIENKK